MRKQMKAKIKTISILISLLFSFSFTAEEKVMIGDDVSVTILGLFGNHVRLGISAPKSVEIHREEIYVKIQNESQDSDTPQIAIGQ